MLPNSAAQFVKFRGTVSTVELPCYYPQMPSDFNNMPHANPLSIKVLFLVTKKKNSTFFHSNKQLSWQTVNSAAWLENTHAAEYCWPTITHTSVPIMYLQTS